MKQAIACTVCIQHVRDCGAWNTGSMHALRPWVSSNTLECLLHACAIHVLCKRTSTVATPRKKCGREPPHRPACRRVTSTQVSCAPATGAAMPTTLPRSSGGPEPLPALHRSTWNALRLA